ncbi:hypothetical protein [Variovorax sp. EL159]|uniref:hypothetical protein n=1 Tax=Variovorax sp. EL159 TaxID=1566270 RepID=UPI00115F7AB7|nr:hypothetical protein [Variovorax sp. EL159]
MCNTLMVSSRKRQEEMRPGPVWQGEGLRMKAASGVVAARHYGRLDFAMHVQPRTTTSAQVASAPWRFIRTGAPAGLQSGIGIRRRLSLLRDFTEAC